MHHQKLSKLYQNRYPMLDMFFNEFNTFINSHNSNYTTVSSSHKYLWDYYKGIRRDIEYSSFLTIDNELVISNDNEELECDNNKTSVYTLDEMADYNLPYTEDHQFQNLDFLLLIIPLLLKDASKKDVLKFLFYYYLNERVEIKEGHEYLGRLDDNYILDDPRIKFRDDKVFQTFSYIIFHKSQLDINKHWIYKNLIPLSKTMGIHISLKAVNDSYDIEYFNKLKSKCVKYEECHIIDNTDEFIELNSYICN